MNTDESFENELGGKMRKTVNFTKAEQFLNALFGAYFQNNQGYVEMRYINLQTNKRRRDFFGEVSRISRFAPALKKLNRGGYNIYFGVNPRGEKSGKEEAISHVVAFHVDLDVKMFNGDKEAALRKLSQFTLPPTLIVDSGNGFHAYWCLKEPIQVTDENREHLRSINRGLALTLGGDYTHDLSRVLRLPGFYNMKDPNNPKPVKIIKLEETLRYVESDFEDFAELGKSKINQARTEQRHFVIDKKICLKRPLSF